MKKILIAGATGYLGRHLVLEAAKRGLEVTALVRPGQTAPGATNIIEAQVTKREDLSGICRGQDAVFSALGITRQTDAVTYKDIEYTANVHLLEEAKAAGVKRFGVISVVAPEHFAGLAITISRELFVKHLQSSDVDELVVRATGFFCDLKEVFEMAQKGRVYLVGDGSPRINPIHGADLAKASLDALIGSEHEINVGGPDIHSWNEIAALAFSALKEKEKTTRVPVWAMKTFLPALKIFHRRSYDIASFILRGATQDGVGPQVGEHHLVEFYKELAAEL